MQIKLTSDNEWEGKYALLEGQFEVDGLPIWALGDLLPTGKKDRAGKNSFFKEKLKDVLGNDAGPSTSSDELYSQMKQIYACFPEEFIENYGECVEQIQKGSQFLQKSKLHQMPAITGNREFDYQLLLDFLATEAGIKKVNYFNELTSCKKFILHTTPEVEHLESTGILWLPYHPEDCFEQDIDQITDSFREYKSERIIILTHENPCPEAVGVKRKVKMQTTLDEYIGRAASINLNVLLFCGHLDISAPSFGYKGATVQPISGTEIITLDLMNGNYSKREL
ncbi:MAG: hypothetical protein Q8O89_07080 [Nanoarchaeota archaeon]|nr:hypothetical protein [Nanoarchaeota archaeon]